MINNFKITPQDNYISKKLVEIYLKCNKNIVIYSKTKTALINSLSLFINNAYLKEVSYKKYGTSENTRYIYVYLNKEVYSNPDGYIEKHLELWSEEPTTKLLYKEKNGKINKYHQFKSTVHNFHETAHSISLTYTVMKYLRAILSHFNLLTEITGNMHLNIDCNKITNAKNTLTKYFFNDTKKWNIEGLSMVDQLYCYTHYNINKYLKKDPAVCKLNKTYFPADEVSINRVKNINNAFPDRLKSTCQYQRIFTNNLYTGGRLYGAIPSLPKILRSKIIKSGNLVEIDLSCAIVNIMNYRETGHFLSKRFYDLILDEIYPENEKSELLPILKKPLITLFNSKIKDCRTTFTQLCNKYEIENTLLDRIISVIHKKLPHLLKYIGKLNWGWTTYIESQSMSKLLEDHLYLFEIPFIIHDAIYVPEQYTDYFKTAIYKYLAHEIEYFKLHEEFKTISYSKFNRNYEYLHIKIPIIYTFHEYMYTFIRNLYIKMYNSLVLYKFLVYIINIVYKGGVVVTI